MSSRTVSPLLVSRTYVDPADAGARFTLPALVLEYDGRRWSVECCFPGCMPEGEAMTFPSATCAVSYAYESARGEWSEFFRFVYCGALHRLRGSIALALADEGRAEALRVDLVELSEDGADHVEDLAMDCARATFAAHPTV